MSSLDGDDSWPAGRDCVLRRPAVGLCGVVASAAVGGGGGGGGGVSVGGDGGGGDAAKVSGRNCSVKPNGQWSIWEKKSLKTTAEFAY